MYLDLTKYQYYMRDMLGNKVYAKRSEEPIQTRIEEPRLTSLEQKINAMNNNLPF